MFFAIRRKKTFLKKVILYFFTISFLYILVFRGDVFVCSPTEQYTMWKTWKPLDESLFCTTEGQPMPGCMSDIPKQLKGPLDVDTKINESEVVNYLHKDLEPGGMWGPSTCVSCYHVAIIMPYRDRYAQLRMLLHFLIPVLQRQHIRFRIFVVEQEGNSIFNKGRLMNAGFKEASKLGEFDCFIFHDVDMIPEDDRNIYTCSSQPRHMSPAVDKFNYQLPYFCLVGGVMSFRREHFQKVNGYSNMYLGWGAEDDDMYKRIKEVGLTLMRPSTHIGRYTMVRHDHQDGIPFIWTYVSSLYTLLATSNTRFQRDGLSSVEYHVTFMKNTKLYTHIMIDKG